MSEPRSPSPTFCIIPWVHLFGDELGQMRPCCMAVGLRDQNNLDENGRPHVVHGDLEAGWNSAFMRDIRRAMLEGRRPNACARCFSDEDLGMTSYRQHSNVKFASSTATAVATTAADGSAPLAVRSLDLRLGNTCNLMCRMCSPVSSKLLIPEWKTIHGAADDPRLLKLERVDWMSSNELWQNCERLIPSLEKLHFAGGEPLLIGAMLDFLARVIESGRAGDITLSYVTNLTSLPQRVTALWPKFRDVDLMVSVDGYGPINEFIRYPSRWSVTDANLQQLVAGRERFNCSAVKVNTTVQAYNVLHLNDLFEYLFERCRGHVSPYPRLSLLYESAAFGVQVLPAEIKQLAAGRLRQFVARWHGRWPCEGIPLAEFLQEIDAVIEHMCARDRSDLFPEFARQTAAFDAARGQDVRDVLPELAPWIDVARTAHSAARGSA